MGAQAKQVSQNMSNATAQMYERKSPFDDPNFEYRVRGHVILKQRVNPTQSHGGEKLTAGAVTVANK